MGFKESKMKEIKIPNIKYDIFLQFLSYLYTGKATINKDNVMLLLPCADQYNVFELRLVCYDFIVRQLSKDSVSKMMIDAQNGEFKFNCDELISKCIQYIDKHTSEVVKTSQFYEFTERTMEQLLKSNRLNIEEIGKIKKVKKRPI
jgi:hypothetical protein